MNDLTLNNKKFGNVFSVAIKQGTIVKCVNGHNIANVVRDIKPGVFFAKHLEYCYNTSKPHIGDQINKLKCAECNNKYIANYFSEKHRWYTLLFYNGNKWIGHCHGELVEVLEEERILNFLTYCIR